MKALKNIRKKVGKKKDAGVVRRSYIPVKKLPGIIARRYQIQSPLGVGSFGWLYTAYDPENNLEVAVKIEYLKTKYPQLLCEKRVYDELHNGGSSFLSPRKMKNMSSSTSSAPMNMLNQKNQPFFHNGVVIGIPLVYWYGMEKNFNILVMEKLGPCLEDLFNFCQRKFSMKTVLMLADQFISRLEFIHENSYIHRDIKAENFLMGTKGKAHHVYAVDFGLAKKYRDDFDRHIKLKKKKSLTGTARYTSINSHLGYEQSRRDDLESIGYLLVYFAKGELPWQGIKAQDKEEKYKKIFQSKMDTKPKKLCKGLPKEFVKYIEYVKGLQFIAKPDYDYLRGLFRKVFQRNGYKLDFMFDWMERKKELYSIDKVNYFADDVFSSLKTQSDTSSDSW